MRIKLDENLGLRARDLLAAAGHDVCTVVQQELCSATDAELATRCATEGRAIVTLDLDFANPLRFPPEIHHGIAVLRAPAHQTGAAIEKLVRTLISAMETQDIEGKLWIVEEGRLRIFQPG
jgi:predicted nuclease of predicted toxin-antitoxin system